MKCLKCGYSIPEDSEYCQYCGAHLNSQLSPEPDPMPTETTASVELVSETVSKAVLSDTQTETVQEESLMSQAYNSYISTNPEEKQFFEKLLGTEELKKAYLEECERNRIEYDKGVRTCFKQSYTDFMDLLYKVYFRPSVDSSTSFEQTKPAATPVVPAAPAPEKTNAPKKNEKHVFCKKCGSIIDPVTKKCSGCGKQYFRAKTMIPIILFVLILVSSVAFNIVQYLQGKEAIETVTAQTTKIRNLENDIAIQRHTIFSQNKTISSQEEKIASLEEKCDYLMWLRQYDL